ncbi:Sterol uptake control protein 2 [Fusarium oxysporum f. sp. albedinis]|nr:Sterol uptake control protein 2 [Fusarium oxysporum f. sp. albedinis]
MVMLPKLIPDLASRDAIEAQQTDIVAVLIDWIRWPCHSIGTEDEDRNDAVVLMRRIGRFLKVEPRFEQHDWRATLTRSEWSCGKYQVPHPSLFFLPSMTGPFTPSPHLDALLMSFYNPLSCSLYPSFAFILPTITPLLPRAITATLVNTIPPLQLLLLSLEVSVPCLRLSLKHRSPGLAGYRTRNRASSTFVTPVPNRRSTSSYRDAAATARSPPCCAAQAPAPPAISTTPAPASAPAATTSSKRQRNATQLFPPFAFLRRLCRTLPSSTPAFRHTTADAVVGAAGLDSRKDRLDSR